MGGDGGVEDGEESVVLAEGGWGGWELGGGAYGESWRRGRGGEEREQMSGWCARVVKYVDVGIALVVSECYNCSRAQYETSRSSK